MDANASPSFTPPPRVTLNPFLADVCATPFEVLEGRSVQALNHDVVQRVASAVEELHASPQKPLLLLTAPRAGYGKTHLLGRVAAVADAQSVAMPLIFRSDVEVTWASVSEECLGALRMLPARTPGWTKLREICAGVFATLVVRLIREGRLPCANKDQAISVLSSDPSDLFREGTQARLIGDWLRKHYGQLRKPIADIASELPGAGVMDAWIDALYAHAIHGNAASADPVVQMATGSRESFELWLRMVSLWRPAVLFVDHLDGFYRMERAGLRIATMLLDLVAIESVQVVLSLNQDVWQATFAHHLPSAMEDRLTASQFLLRGLTADDATDMLRLRLRGASVDMPTSDQFERFIGVARWFQGRPVGSVSARAFLRHAAQQWQTFEQMRARGEDPSASSLIDSAVAEEVPSPQADPLPDVPTFGHPLPSIFGNEDTAFVQSAARSLSEPDHAMVNTPFAVAAEGIAVVPPAPSLLQPSSPFAVAPPPWANNTPPPAPQSQPSSPGALDRLREMIDRLRTQPSPATQDQATPIEDASPVTQRLANVLAEASNDPLLARFQQARNEFSEEATQAPLNLDRIASLISLAGKRFTLVRFDAVDLPGLPGKTVPRWALHDQEIVFGLGPLDDRSYWRVLSQFAAGRIASFSNPSMKFKLAVLKSDRDTALWNTLQSSSDVIPDHVRTRIDVVHLDNRSIASLYAMQRVIADAESGTLQATPSQVMAVLARELDFFWKRITRPA